MSATATKPRKGPPKGKPRKEYPAKIVRYAQRLVEDCDFTLDEVRESLRKLGHTPSRVTVQCWVDPEFKASRNGRKRAKYVRRGTSKREWQWRLDRMRELRDAGLSFTAIAAVMRCDFDLTIDGEEVRSILQGKLTAKTTRLRLFPEAVSD